MNLIQSLSIALEMLRLHKLRAFLTMLGVIIGVMSVTIIVMISTGFQNYMSGEFKKLGADTIMIMYDDWGNNREKVASIDGLRVSDVDYILNRASSIEYAIPMAQVPGEKISVGDSTMTDPRIYGSDERFKDLNAIEMIQGRFFSKEDVTEMANVAVIGEEVRDRLYGKQDPIGRILPFQGITLTVAGVFKKKSVLGNDNGKDIIVPISTVQKKWVGGDRLMMISARPRPGVDSKVAMDDVWQALMLKSGNKRVYRVDSSESIQAVIGNVFGAAGVILAAVAALSLLVGGIGIMNIMLVSVTERTKEIGLRKAVGAKSGAILGQFIVEAATLSLVGGLIGMGIAWVLGQGVTLATAQAKWPNESGLPMTFPLTAAFGAAAFSAFIGVVFGFYPAMSASKLDPIVALRRE